METALGELGRRSGYQVQRSRGEHAGRKLFLGYLASDGTRDRIEVDLNFLFREPLGEIRRLTMWQPDGRKSESTVAVVSIEELCAGKLCALLGRAQPRALFDVTRLPLVAGPLWGTRRLRRLFIALSAVLEHPLLTYGSDRLDRVSQPAIEAQLLPMMAHGEAVSAVELKARALEVVGPLLELDEAEREYVERIQLGELRPTLLFPDDESLALALARHPALLWKAQNAKAHATR